MTDADATLWRQRFVESWPYSPHLIDLLEDHILVATQAQETRDLISILVELFKRAQTQQHAVITAANFLITDKNNDAVSALNAMSRDQHSSLKRLALHNREAVRNSLRHKDVPFVDEILSSLWVRSLKVGNVVGARRSTCNSISRATSPSMTTG